MLTSLHRSAHGSNDDIGMYVEVVSRYRSNFDQIVLYCFVESQLVWLLFSCVLYHYG